MAPPRVYKVDAVVLKHTRLGETDRVLTLFTPHLGKMRAVAKGVAKPTSRMAGHLQPLTQTSLLVARGRTLDVITQAQTLDSFRLLREELWRTSAGLYLAELVDRFTEEHSESRPLYDLVARALRWLCVAPAADLPLRSFEIQMLEHLGYRPELYHCLGCMEELEPRAHRFSPQDGGLRCARCIGAEGGRPVSLNAQKVLRLLQRDDRSTIARLRLDPSLAAELERLLRQYLTYLLERDLKSTAFLDLVRRQEAAGGTPAGATPATG
ncbi:MAG: DNA repair protein RecO [Chloroflexi bacterium]|nr:DNA repair protein RecO [Chloroflexota bacterium]